MVEEHDDIAAPGPELDKLTHQQALDTVGRLVVAGAPGYQPGDALSADTLARRAGISKAAARYVVQALSQMRLLEIVPRVGATVQDLTEWNMLEPAVIGWRLEQPAPRHVRRSLTELRAAIEPAAARLAAMRAPASLCRDVLNLGESLFDIGKSKPFNRKEFRDTDARHHTAVLTASGNEAFRSLAHAVVLEMNHRIDQQWAGDRKRQRPSRPGSDQMREFPERPTDLALWLHRCQGRAIAYGQPAAAEALTRGLLAEADDELLTDAQLGAFIDDGLDNIELPASDRREVGDLLAAAQEEARERLQKRLMW